MANLLIEGVARTYQSRRRAVRALAGVTLSIEPGSWVALLGPNGSGKSTLLRILATKDRPDEGSVTWFGQGAAAVEVVRRGLGVVFQSPAVDAVLTPRELLGVQAALMAIPDAGARIEGMADRFGFADRLDDRIGGLSGGLVRRVDLARALLHEPGLLLLDEPSTGLDHAARTGFLDLLERWRVERATTVVLSTHLMDEAERADRVVMMSRGSIVADGTPAALRAAAGGMRVRVAEQHADALHNLGLAWSARGSVAEAALAPERASEVAGSLAARMVPFECTPPTLADAYLASTGESLTPEDAA